MRGNSNPMTVRHAVYGIQRKLGLVTKQNMGVWTARSGLLDDEEMPKSSGVGICEIHLGPRQNGEGQDVPHALSL